MQSAVRTRVLIFFFSLLFSSFLFPPFFLFPFPLFPSLFSADPNPCADIFGFCGGGFCGGGWVLLCGLVFGLGLGGVLVVVACVCVGCVLGV